MAHIIGQVYNPRLETKEVDGKTKTSFFFSLGTRKAFVNEGEAPNLFTQCATYQPGLAEALSKFFGQSEHKGKAISVSGHFDEYEWMPNPDNPNHDKFFQEFKITSDILAQGGISLAQGSATEVTIMVPMKQTTRRFIVSGFEFCDSASTTPKTTTPTGAPKVKVAPPEATTTPQATTAIPLDDDAPF